MTECRNEVCVTCSDELLEAVVDEVVPGGATAHAHIDGVACEVSVELLDGVRPGDHVLVHGGVALQAGTLEATR